MRNNRIVLDDTYFIEIDSLNWILKKNRKSPKSQEKIIGYYASLRHALLSYKDELIKKTCLQHDREVLISEVVELLNSVQKWLETATSTLKSQEREVD